MQRVSTRRLEAAIRTLGDLAGEEHVQLDGATRDELAHLRYVLEEILEARLARGGKTLLQVLDTL